MAQIAVLQALFKKGGLVKGGGVSVVYHGHMFMGKNGEPSLELSD
jgi:hypothetical protein